jgi:hypothetical protein
MRITWPRIEIPITDAAYGQCGPAQHAQRLAVIAGDSAGRSAAEGGRAGQAERGLRQEQQPNARRRWRFFHRAARNTRAWAGSSMTLNQFRAALTSAPPVDGRAVLKGRC